MTATDFNVKDRASYIVSCKNCLYTACVYAEDSQFILLKDKSG